MLVHTELGQYVVEWFVCVCIKECFLILLLIDFGEVSQSDEAAVVNSLTGAYIYQHP